MEKEPWLFAQERFGKDEVPFSLLKIKTLKDVPEETFLDYLLPNGTLSKDDPRIIKGRGIFRRTGMDEIPEIVNILKGEMNFFGPRPLQKVFHEQLTPEQKERYKKYKPGIFGGHAFWRQNSPYSNHELQDIYCRLREKKSKEGSAALVQFHAYVFLHCIRAVIQGKLT
jgi:lipopolysaccharide/colanic/teichoic acid biosynthesis glycosyltransferase